MSDALNELGAHIEAKRPDCVLAWDVTHGELNIDVTPGNIPGFVEFLKADNACRFSSLCASCARSVPLRSAQRRRATETSDSSSANSAWRV